jgi:hypothetical protein
VFRHGRIRHLPPSCRGGGVPVHHDPVDGISYVQTPEIENGNEKYFYIFFIIVIIIYILLYIKFNIYYIVYKNTHNH